MIKLSPNLSWLFADRPFAERIDAAAEAGFTAFEFGFYGGADLEAVQKAVEGGMQVALFNMDIPDWRNGVRGYLAHPNMQTHFRRALDDGLVLAQRIKAKAMMIPTGVRDLELPLEEQIECAVDNLALAAPLAEEADVMLTIEALYPGDVPDYFLDSSHLGIEIVRQVNHPNVKFQFDTYHLQMLEGDLIESLRKGLDWIGHIQLGDAPGRVTPGGGEIDIIGFVEAAMEAGYDGFFGLEYHPGQDPLGWIPPTWMQSRAN
jgi:hydroxypyruvate isomerase